MSKKQPLSVAEILEKQKQESALKPRFLSKAERAQKAQKEKEEEERKRALKQQEDLRKRQELESQARSAASSSRQADSSHARPSERHHRDTNDLDYGSAEPRHDSTSRRAREANGRHLNGNGTRAANEASRDATPALNPQTARVHHSPRPSRRRSADDTSGSKTTGRSRGANPRTKSSSSTGARTTTLQPTRLRYRFNRPPNTLRPRISSHLAPTAQARHRTSTHWKLRSDELPGGSTTSTGAKRRSSR